VSSAVIRGAAAADVAAIAGIYNHYVRETIVTFEEEPVAAEQMGVRIASVAADGLPWLVAEQGGEIVGYAYATKWKERVAYRYSVESTVYVAPGSEGRGLASALYSALFERLAELGVHAVMAGIALPNERSVALHEKFGLAKVAHFREVGFKFGQWIDVGYWEGLV
jgi:phosphinothricin acetyltransferase